MSKIYQNSVGVVFEVTTGINLAGATVNTYKVKEPDGTEVTWAATVKTALTGILTYTNVAADLDQTGIYVLQAYVEVGGGKYWGETTSFPVYAKYD